MKRLLETLLKESRDVAVDESKLDMILGPKGKRGPGHTDTPDRPVFEADEEAETVNTDPERVDPGVPGEYDKKIYKLPFSLSDIVSVYVGRPNRCMCGCSGTYWYASAHRDYGTKDRGYEVGDDEVSDDKVKRVYNKMQRNVLTKGVEVIDDYIYTMVIGNTQYTIYLKKPGK